MKPTIDPAAVSAIATAAFLAYNPEYREQPDIDYPGAILEEALGLEGFIHNQSAEHSNAAVTAFDRALAFGLQVGARIGADPQHLPNVEDLIVRYRIPQARIA